MTNYLDLLRDIVQQGIDIPGRNGLVRTSFGSQLRYDLREGFPIITTKKVPFKVVTAELLGFIRGYTHIKDFNDLGCYIWDANAEDWDKEGNLGRIYGAQWRDWKSVHPETNKIISIDQLLGTIENLKKDPYSRRHIISSWNPGELPFTALPPCHLLLQFHVTPDKFLSLIVYQRSGDIFLGIPFNISSYSLLLSLVAQVTDLKPLYFIHSLGNIHLYHEHFDVATQQLTRTPLNLPKLRLNQEITQITDFDLPDIKLINYQSHSSLKAKMIV